MKKKLLFFFLFHCIEITRKFGKMPSDEEINKFNEIFTGLQSEVLKMMYKKYYSEIVRNSLKQRQYEGTKLQEVYDTVMVLRKEETVGQYYFITICPYEDIKIEEFQKVMEKVLKKKWMKSYLYVYEQRQSEKEKPFTGIHVHMLVKRIEIAKSDVIREVYNTCKNIVGSKQSIDVKLLKTQQDLDVRINYLLGKKSTEEKQLKQEIDKIFRCQYGLEQYYLQDDSGMLEELVHTFFSTMSDDNV